MVLLKLLSENPELGFVIVKNPATGMQVREVRKGWAFGYYHSSNPQEYRILFRDAQNDISYKEHQNQEYEYLDKLRFSSPIFVLNAITEFFKSTVTKRHEKDLPNFIHTFTVNLVTVDRRSMTVISKFDKFFPDYEIKIEQISGAENLYRVNVTSKLSVHHLLNLVTILFGVVSILNQNDLDLNDGLVERLVKATNIVDAPYYIRYLVCSRCLSKGAYFKRYKSELETPGVTFFYGDTATQRKEYIRGLLSFDFPIIDVGCGEGFYAIPFAKILAKRGDHLYHAVDTDPIELAKVRGRAKQQEIVKLLLEHGANPHMTDKYGKTPLELAREKSYHEIADLLLAAGA